MMKSPKLTSQVIAPAEIAATVRAERLRLCEFLDELGDSDWTKRSLCSAWTVREVVAHLTTTTRATVPVVIKAAIRARGSFDRMTADVACHRAAAFTPTQLVQQLRESAESSRRMPGSGPMDPLMDLLVHGQDIARPLERRYAMRTDVAVPALAYVAANRFLGGPKRVAGLELVATDAAWSSGQGPQVRGTAEDLLLVAAGRSAGLAYLTGPGVDLLARRLAPTGERAAPRVTDVWALVHAERAALAVDLADLTDDQWATPSLCAGLTVREVLAHLTSAAGLTPARWMIGVIRCRFDFDKQVAVRLAEQLGASATETLTRFRRAVTSTTKPPLPVLAMLGETIVHGADIRRPLGIRRDHPIETITRVAEYYRGTDQVVLAKGRIGGLRLVATDGPFTVGSGPLVSGSTLALTMAMTGRTAYCDDLHGDGVATLRERCGTA